MILLDNLHRESVPCLPFAPDHLQMLAGFMPSVSAAPSLASVLPSLPPSLLASLAADPSLLAAFPKPLDLFPSPVPTSLASVLGAMQEQQPPMILCPSPIAPTPVPAVMVKSEPPPTPAVDNRRVFNEMCVVCGDRATGLHYNVASCNGCKTFFRRTIICNRRFKCHKAGNCDFNKDIRCACRACRFQKCINVGMNPRAIQCNRTPQGFALNGPGSVATPLDLVSLAVSPCSVVPSTTSRPITPLSQPSTSSASPAPTEDVKAFAIGLAECDEMVSEMLAIDSRMSQLKGLQYNGGPLLDLLTTPPAIEFMEDIEPSAAPAFFASEEKRIEHWLNYELTMATEWMKTHIVFRKLTFFDKCTMMEDTMLAVVLLNAACEAAARGERELRYPDGSAMRFSDECGNVADLVDAMARSSMDKAMFVLVRALTFLNPDAFGLTPEGRAKVDAERRRIMHALGTYIFHRHGKKSPGMLGEVLAMPATALALGRRVRVSPPAPAPLLFVKGPLPALMT